MDSKYKRIYDEFLERYDEEHEIILCIEEMSELTKELSKYLRYKGTDKEKLIKENIKEEIADVINTVGQMQNIFGIEEIDDIRDKKLNNAIKK